jgi:FkbM family methyltransferase
MYLSRGFRRKKLAQDSVLVAYRLVSRSGILRTKVGQYLFEVAYGRYKAHFEATGIGSLRDFARPGATVIDVGGFIGFFAVQFGRWVGPGGKVVAIEPDAQNFAMLRRAVKRAGLENIVEPIFGASAEAKGTLHLRTNPDHPADHRLGESGTPVPSYAIDDLMAERGWPPVSLIKIDVQGAEPRVLRGARETLTRFRPALFIEVDDDALAQAGFSADELIVDLEELGYRLYRLDRRAGFRPIDAAEAADLRAELGYADFLLLTDEARDRCATA